MAQRKRDSRSFRERYRIYIAAGITAWVLFMFIHPVSVKDAAMFPLLNDGQIVIVSKENFKSKSPPLYSVVNFRRGFTGEADMGKNAVRRVVGVSGDTMEIRNGVCYRNGERLPSPYDVCQKTDSLAPITLGPGEVFVLGDNRDQSVDSRTAAPLLMKDIRGICSFVVWPLNEWGRIEKVRIGEQQES
jgi:signal peptidase I